MGHRKKFTEGEYLSGLTAVNERLQVFVDGMKEAAGQGLADAALYVLGEAAVRAPVDSGDLRGSGAVDLDGQRIAQGTESGDYTVTGFVPSEAKSAEIGFNAKYAADQHEQVHYYHPKGGQAKYLESVLIEEQQRILNTIAGRIQNMTEGNGNA